ncbi:MAG: ABC transporter permease [Candidatus Aminicenantes bacterium]|nr:ABC transporter permease [Candidatus Aminicenantes bacterium]NIM83487.1 ABC transporter permease [Candidatus Aminicenantes bacterium]NIN22879.1 ABC transporter permease [Candidatus Aminicenantes bacterium]NIN46615.1 ABC transporter permease [Candidatus Aminicenantes bacterium]NIN89518.1 ABC transporter permease [Candidatus Aminicenantes bacterium]
MRIRRIGILLKKELLYGSRSYFFIFAVAAPLAATLFLNLVFSSLFSQKPELGVMDQGNSQIVEALKHMKSINLKEYASEMELKDAVETGGRDVGIVLQENFDAMIKKGKLTKITAYVWGESLLKNRAIISSALLYQIRDISGKEVPVDIIPVSLGEKNNIPLKDRFLPVIVLMTIFLSGFAIPSTSLVGEKQKGTIGAVLTTPVTQNEIFVSKGLMGIIVSMVMGIVILILNQAFNTQFVLIIFILLGGAIMASCFGLILGTFSKDISSVYSAIEGLNVFIYAPGIVCLIPQIPQWVGKFFPTYYVINPIMEITQKGGTWSTVNRDVLTLIGIIAVFFALVGVIAVKKSQQET